MSKPDSVRVKTHPGACLGWGQCNLWAPHVYPLDHEGHVGIHKVEVGAEHAEDAWWGAIACPEQAISVHGRPLEYWREQNRRAKQETGDR